MPLAWGSFPPTALFKSIAGTFGTLPCTPHSTPLLAKFRSDRHPGIRWLAWLTSPARIPSDFGNNRPNFRRWLVSRLSVDLLLLGFDYNPINVRTCYKRGNRPPLRIDQAYPEPLR